MEYYSAFKKKEILPFTTTWMELENTMLNEMSVTEAKFNLISKAWSIQIQIDKFVHQNFKNSPIYKILLKGKVQKHICGRNMFLKSLISRIYKELSKSNNKETNNPLKWVKYMNTHFTKKMWYIYTMVYY